MPRLMLAVALTSSVLAQGGPIYIVDAASGPGTNYTNVQTAVLAVPDGSTLLVRPGLYAPVSIVAKGITILGDPSFTLGYPPGGCLTVLGTQAHQRVLVRGLLQWNTSGYVRVTNAAGPVTLDGANQVLWNGDWTSSPLIISDSHQVDVRNWTIQSYTYVPACSVTNSSVVFELCTLVGASAATASSPSLWNSQPGLSVSTSYIELVDTRVTGGHGSAAYSILWPGSAAVVMTAGSLRALGPSSQPITGGTTRGPVGGQLPAIIGTGIARVEPNIPLSVAPTGVTLTQSTMPSLLADSALPGGVVTARRSGAPAVACLVAISLRAPQFTVPWLPDPIWLDPLGLVVQAAGITPPTGPFVVTINVPNAQTLRGFEFVWQAVDLDPTGIVAVTNPSPSFVR